MDKESPLYPLRNVSYTVLGLLDRSMIQADIRSLRALLAQVCNACSHDRRVNASLKHIREQGILPCQQSSHIDPLVVC